MSQVRSSLAASRLMTTLVTTLSLLTPLPATSPHTCGHARRRLGAAPSRHVDGVEVLCRVQAAGHEHVAGQVQLHSSSRGCFDHLARRAQPVLLDLRTIACCGKVREWEGMRAGRGVWGGKLVGVAPSMFRIWLCCATVWIWLCYVLGAECPSSQRAVP
eukprot:365986-Chlamydomonas_euryale.AAC.12